jgi:uncharacterized membrane protein
VYSKTTLGWLYFVSVILGVLVLPLVISTQIEGAAYNSPLDVILAFSALLCGILSVILYLFAWVGTLTNLSRKQQWAWFVLTFFFGIIMIFFYLAFGPDVPKGEQAQRDSFSSESSHQPAMQASQSQPSALEILQQRLARGEIDEQTYVRLRSML